MGDGMPWKRAGKPGGPRRRCRVSLFMAPVFGLTYCSQLVIARIVGVDTYGVVCVCLRLDGSSWRTSRPLGFDVGLLRFVPAYEAERAWPLLQGVIQYAQRRAAFVGLSITFIGICVVKGLGGSSPELRSTFSCRGLRWCRFFALVRDPLHYRALRLAVWFRRLCPTA